MGPFEYWHLWLIAASALLIAEIFTAGFLLACFAVGALISTLPALLGLSPEWQLAVFAIASLLSLYWLKPFLKRISTKPEVRSGTDALIGRELRLPSALEPSTPYVEIAIGGDVWRARGQHGQSIAQGSTVRVVAREGLTLLLEEVAQ